MNKSEHKKMMTFKEKTTGWKELYYLDIYCGTYSPSYTKSEAKETAYKELKERNLLVK